MPQDRLYLAPMSHEEGLATRVTQRRYDPVDSEAITIGLDRGAGGGRAG